jgi:hypothetical protein
VKNRNHLNVHQQRFLRACRDEPGALDSQVKKFKISSSRLSRWLRREPFRAALAEVLRDIYRKRKLEFELAARQATHLQSQILSGQAGCTHLQRQTSYDVLELYRQMHPRRPGRKAQHAAPAPAPQEPALIHPDISLEEADKLLKEMDGGPLRDAVEQ